jgi:KUP system potassium uptake protein
MLEPEQNGTEGKPEDAPATVDAPVAETRSAPLGSGALSSAPGSEVPDGPDINWSDRSAASVPGMRLLSVDQLPKGSLVAPAGKAHGASHTPSGKHLAGLTLGALGVVYGDIGTSPLYALRECFHHGVPVSEANVLGVLSLMVWSLVLIVSVKYLLYVLRADNKGEGGILALAALTSSAVKTPHRRVVVVALGIFGAALLYGDGAITPAISVLSAVEGLGVAAPALKPMVLPITVAILVLIFSIQRHGTARVGNFFGPVMILWFLVLATTGVLNLIEHGSVLAALSPHHGVLFFMNHGAAGVAVLGSVMLVVTGGEALYADLGHFGPVPIRRAWFALVFPALILNYLGQGALLIADPSALENPFYRLAPDWALIPLVILSTCAAVIASQALISGVFSMTRQATMLGFLPRVNVLHTSAHERGQVYVPAVNWLLMLATIALVLGFRSSSALAGAYGVAVIMTMVITTMLAFDLGRFGWGWSLPQSIAVTALFLLPEVFFLGANITKVAEGGWFPLVLAVGLFVVMTTWQRGRGILSKRFRQQMLPLKTFFRTLRKRAPVRVTGTAVFMTSSKDGTPLALLHNFEHNHVVHSRIILLTILTDESARVEEAQRSTIEELGHGFTRVIARYGFMEHPDVPALLRQIGLIEDFAKATFFLGRETMITTDHSGMAGWRVHLFSYLSRNAQPATKFFHIPPDRVMELGAQIEL